MSYYNFLLLSAQNLPAEALGYLPEFWGLFSVLHSSDKWQWQRICVISSKSYQSLCASNLTYLLIQTQLKPLSTNYCWHFHQPWFLWTVSIRLIQCFIFAAAFLRLSHWFWRVCILWSGYEPQVERRSLQRELNQKHRSQSTSWGGNSCLKALCKALCIPCSVKAGKRWITLETPELLPWSSLA